MFLSRISLCFILSLMLISCTPQFNEDFYLNKAEIKHVITLSDLMNDAHITQLIRLNEQLIIINGVIVNTAMKTYGVPPKAGFSKAYTESASTNKYIDWRHLIELMPDKNLPLKSKIDHLFKLMADSGVKEYHYDKDVDVHVFQSGSSVLKGFYGVLIGIESASKSISTRENYDYFNEIQSGVYYFELR